MYLCEIQIYRLVERKRDSFVSSLPKCLQQPWLCQAKDRNSISVCPISSRTPSSRVIIHCLTSPTPPIPPGAVFHLPVHVSNAYSSRVWESQNQEAGTPSRYTASKGSALILGFCFSWRKNRKLGSELAFRFGIPGFEAQPRLLCYKAGLVSYITI